MNVLEVVKAYNLADFDKTYKNVYGNCVDLSFSIDELSKLEVKDLYINLKERTATITVLF